MNEYELKQEARRQRLEDRAATLQREGAARIGSGMDRLRAIPFGQPILIGHHSEKRDRNYRRKAGAAIDKGFALQKQAGELVVRAAAVGTGGISSDDPEAVTKLKEKLAELEARQAHMVQVNKLVRKGDRGALELLGHPTALIDAWFTPDFMGRKGYAGYELTNNSGNMRRIRLRIEELKRNASRETVETEHPDGIRVVENAEANRLQIFFPGKPPREHREILKRHGFRWSPSEGAWQRFLNGRHHADWVLEAIDKLKGQATLTATQE